MKGYSDANFIKRQSFIGGLLKIGKEVWCEYPEHF